MSPRPEDATGFDHRCRVILNVLKDFVGKDHIKGLVGIGQILCRALSDTGQGRAGLSHLGRVDIDAVGQGTELAEALHIETQTTAHVQQRTAMQRDVAAGKSDTSFLPLSPHIARMSEIYGFGLRCLLE
jgi:hypothetical protein